MSTKISIIILFLISYNCLGAQDIVINELLASSDSLSGISDYAGEYDDWLELYNTSSSTIDISGWTLSDELIALDKWAFPAGTSIEADSYLIVWCDNDSFQNGLHAYFKLTKMGEIITLSNSSGVVDQVSFDPQTTNTSWARQPNGTGAFAFDVPTFNCSNDAEYGPLLSSSDLVINEVLSASDSTGTITDASGKVEDWVELFNKTSQAINLYGYYLSDSPTNRYKWQIPFGTILPADGYLTVWCDNDQEQPDLHTNFNLSSTGESMILSYHDASIIDITTWPVQSANTSYARLPNGTGSFQIDNTPSFGENNNDGSSIEDYFDNRINAHPSPVRDVMHLSLNSSLLTNALRFKLIDMAGKSWLSYSIHSSELSIDVPSSIPSGLYFIQVENGMERVVRKIVVE